MTIVILNKRVYKVKTIILSFGYKMQNVTKVLKIFKIYSKYNFLIKIVNIYKATSTKIKTRDIINYQLINFLIL